MDTQPEPQSQPEFKGIIFEGRRYYSPQEASVLFRIHPQTIYYWIREEHVRLLDLVKACADTPFTPEHIRGQSFIEELSLLSKIKETRE